MPDVKRGGIFLSGSMPGFQSGEAQFSPRALVVIGILALSMVTALAFTAAPEPPKGGMEVIDALKLAVNEPLDQGEEIYTREERIGRGERLDQLFARLGISDEDIRRRLLSTPETQIMHRQLVPGRIVEARVRADGSLVSLYFPLKGGEKGVQIEEQNGRLEIREVAWQLVTRQIMKRGEIRYSLFGATDSLGIPDSIAIQMAEIFSGDIDFHRDLRQGDSFSLVYEMRYLRGRPVGEGRILAAEFINAGRAHQAFYFTHENGTGDYYNAGGERLRKAFLRTPLAFSRITSGFALRLHPILKSWRRHKGVDYGAPTGTPVRATGDGVVRFIGQQGGYGNVVILSHQDGRYQTAYAHLSGFSALKQGSRVSQGDTIGYVGSTGWATGPHLHYEFRVHGNAVNPLSITIPAAVPLTVTQKVDFQQKSVDLKAWLALLQEVPVARFE